MWRALGEGGDRCGCGHFKIDHDDLGCVVSVGNRFCKCQLILGQEIRQEIERRIGLKNGDKNRL